MNTIRKNSTKIIKRLLENSTKITKHSFSDENKDGISLISNKIEFLEILQQPHIIQRIYTENEKMFMYYWGELSYAFIDDFFEVSLN